MSRILHPADRDPALGDLVEEYRRVAADEGRRVADRWYRRQIVRAVAPSLGRRLGGWNMGAGLGREVRHAARALRRRPGLSVVVVLTLALGIGATTAIYSLVHSVLLRPLPYPDEDRLVTVWNTYDSWRGHEILDALWDNIALSWPEFVDWRDGQTTFEDVAIYGTREGVLTGAGEPAVLIVGSASPSLLPMLGAGQQLGRSFTEEEVGPGAPRIAVLSYELWQDRYGSDPAVVGRTVHLDGDPYEVVGVLERGFRVRALEQALVLPRHAVWLPIGADGGSLQRGSHYFEAVGLLAEGASLEAARAETVAILRGDADPAARGARVLTRKEAEVGDARGPLAFLLAAVGLLMLIACGNVAALFVAEAGRRRPELATRAALGACRARILRQLTVESLLLGIAGAGLGGVAAYLGTHLLLGLAPAGLPIPTDLSVSRGSFLVALVLGSGSGLALGLLPGLAVHPSGLNEALRGSGGIETRSGRRLQRTVVAGQLAVSMILLVWSGLLIRSLSRQLAVDPGYEVGGLVTAALSLTEDRYPTPNDAHRFYEQLEERLEALPGVEGAAATSAMPFGGRGGSSSFDIVGREVPENAKEPEANRRTVTADFTELLGLRLLAGRALVRADRTFESPVVLVSESMAERFWPGESAVGARIARDQREWEIVGVVSDVLDGNLTVEVQPTFYVPLPVAERRHDMTVVLRSRLPVEQMVALVREAVRGLDPDVPVDDVETAASLVARSTEDERFRSLLLLAFATVATLLSAIGLFGVTARSVTARGREMGIRVALGAAKTGLVRQLALSEARVLGIGLGLGIVGAVAARSLLSGFLFGVEPTDPMTLLGAGALLATVGLVATLAASMRLLEQDVVSVIGTE